MYTRVQHLLTIGIIVALGVVAYTLFFSGPQSGSATHSVPITESRGTDSPQGNDASRAPTDTDDTPPEEATRATDSRAAVTPSQRMTSREIYEAESITLPLDGSAPTENVRHSIPIEEIRRGCFQQDCIPSVDDPEFISVSEANDILPEDTVGIALSHKGVERFYPFNMLVTREIVNDTVAGDPLLITYCPLCGTGIVFDRTVDGRTYEFGVSGMLWQSNLLMYNRAPDSADRNLWSQVLGEAVVGNKTGTKLDIVPSNIVRYTDWRTQQQSGEVLDTGSVGDPYGGDYYGVAQNFSPNFDASSSPLDPSAYVFGIEVDGQFKAYPRSALPVGVTNDTFAGEDLTITKTEADAVTITDARGETVPAVAGFWFSWVAAHPDTALWQND